MGTIRETMVTYGLRVDFFHLCELGINQHLQNRQCGHHRALVHHPLLEGLEIRFQDNPPDGVGVVLLAGPPVPRGVEISQVALRDVVEDGLGLDGLVGKAGGGLGEDLGAEMGVWSEEVGVEVGEDGGEDGEGGVALEGLEGVGEVCEVGERVGVWVGDVSEGVGEAGMIGS